MSTQTNIENGIPRAGAFADNDNLDRHGDPLGSHHGGQWQVEERINQATRSAPDAPRRYCERPDSYDAMIRQSAAREPMREAVVCGGRRLNWGEFDNMIERCAHGLIALGLRPGGRVAVMLDNRLEYLVAMLGSIRAGGIAVPLGTRLGPADVAHILADSAPQVAITAAQWAGMFAGPQRPARVLLIDDDSGGDGDFFAQLSAPRTTLPPLARSEVAMIVYTSGTTGKPKGACLTHDNFIHTCLHYLYALAIDAPLRSLLVVPGTHIAGFGPVISVTLASAGTLIMQPQFKPDEVLGVMARERITYTVLVPAMYQLLGLRSTLADFDLSAWKYGIYGGAIMPPATIERFSKVVPELRMINAYGATETCAVCTIMPPELTQSAPASVGLALECDDLLIVDDKGHPVAVGESGELWIRGPNVSPGYWNNPAATDSAFANGYWKSGDVGHRDANGLIYVSDRLKDMINRGGFKVFSAEVENTLLTHPEVDDCAVVAVPDPVLGEKSWAKITTHSSTLNAVALRSWLLERIADYKVPDFWNLGPEPVPRNQNGKVQKGQLRDTAMAEVATTSARSSTHFPPN